MSPALGREYRSLLSQSSNIDRSADANTDNTDDGVCLEVDGGCLTKNTVQNTHRELLKKLKRT